ncbi:MAG: SRPBCC domain-containing protein [Gammaproteobacteria bacterium]|nr:SRPBCC domain-containing protein [Gammaproteobacteria bacterium]
MSTVELATIFDAPITLVWEAITDTRAISQWCMHTDFVPEVGRKFQYLAKPNLFWRGYVDCQVLTIEKPNLLRFSWQSVASHSPTVVTYRLEAVGSKTEFCVTHDGFDSTHGLFNGLFMRVMIGFGLKKEILERLPKVLEHAKESDNGRKIV